MKLSKMLIALAFISFIVDTDKKNNSGHAHDTESHAHPHNETGEHIHMRMVALITTINL